MGHLGAARELEHHGRKMRRGSVAGRAVVHLAVACLEMADQLGNGLCRKLRIHDQQVRQVHKQRDGLEIPLNVVWQLGIEEPVDDVAAQGPQQQRVAVGRRLRHHAGADAAAGTRPVLDHERNAELHLHVLLQYARKQVRRAPCGERHHDRHRPLRPVLRVSGRRYGKNGGNGNREYSVHLQPPARVVDAGTSKLDAGLSSSGVTPPSGAHPASCRGPRRRSPWSRAWRARS